MLFFIAIVASIFVPAITGDVPNMQEAFPEHLIVNSDLLKK